MRAMGSARIVEWVLAKPNSIYARRAWFFFEWLTGERLDLPDARTTAGVGPALDPKRHVVTPGTLSPRHRIVDNLLGTPDLCPVVRRTPRLEEWGRIRMEDRLQALIAGCDPALLARAVNYLYTKETRSSFEIERETPSLDRARRFVEALRHPQDLDLASEADFVALQKTIVDPRYAAKGWRDFQNFVGGMAGGYRPEVDCVFPKPEDVPGLMRGLARLAGRVAGNQIEPVVAAALVAFAFVFIHPFEDGNGRIHRFLIHHVLTSSGLTPRGILFPVSACMVRNRRAYDAALESVSNRLMPFVAYRWTEGDQGDVVVENDTLPLYRFFDATALAEYLYGCVDETIQKDFIDELAFLTVFDRVMAALKERVDMPDRRAGRFIQFCLQNGGRLSKAKRGAFSELTDAEVADLEEVVRAASAGTGPATERSNRA
ncbi:MAG: Fic family protein [Geminicoccaceae bacterium]|nr:Fic family protein [Geminicoccaceae bacterium]